MYPWHPLSGQVVEVRGAASHAGVVSYVIALPDGTLCALPIWMTVLGAARDAVIHERAVVSRRALEALHGLVDEIRGDWARSVASPRMPPAAGDKP